MLNSGINYILLNFPLLFYRRTVVYVFIWLFHSHFSSNAFWPVSHRRAAEMVCNFNPNYIALHFVSQPISAS